MIPVLLLSLAALQGAPAAPTPPALEAASPEARETWRKVCAATLLGSAEEVRPVTAFELWLEVLDRGGTGSNEFRPRLAWLAPRFLRFEISDNLEQGFGPEGYWLRENDEPPISLAERHYEEDRAQIDELQVVVQNFVALTHPGGLELRRLASLEDPPQVLADHPLGIGRMKRRLEWIELESPDFRLPSADANDPWAVRRDAVVTLGVDRESSLPIVAVLREKGSNALPVVLRLERHAPLDDLRVPKQVWVYGFEPGPEGPALAREPRQEMNVLRGTVRAKLAPEDFSPTR